VSLRESVYLTWETRSRVGSTTSARNLVTTLVDKTSTTGIAYASVFPLPVGADTQTSDGGSYGRYNARAERACSGSDGNK
jgi:hypothetical protein